MNRLQFFALIGHQNDREFWYELVTMRSGELCARAARYLSWNRGRQLADYLANKYGIEDRAGMYCGRIMRVEGAY